MEAAREKVKVEMETEAKEGRMPLEVLKGGKAEGGT